MNKTARIIAIAFTGILSLAAQRPPFGGSPGFAHEVGAAFDQIVTGAPYSGILTTQITQTLPDGNQIQQERRGKVFRDMQGRVRTEGGRTSRDGEARNFITIVDPVSGFVAQLDVQAATAVKYPFPGDPGRVGGGIRHHAVEEGGPEIQTQELGNKVINGLSATGKQIIMTIAAGEIGNSEPIQMVREVWTSSALKVALLTNSNDPHFGKSTMRLTSVSRAEPDPALFRIPSDYAVSAESGPPRWKRRGAPGSGPNGPPEE